MRQATARGAGRPALPLLLSLLLLTPAAQASPRGPSLFDAVSDANACVLGGALHAACCAAVNRCAPPLCVPLQPHTAGGTRRRLLQTTLDLAATTNVVGKTPAIIGINAGHRAVGSNWPLWMSRLGTNSARVFLSALWGASLESWVGGSTKWGLSLSGTPVTDVESFQAAVAQLRTPAGHDPAQASSFANPVR